MEQTTDSPRIGHRIKKLREMRNLTQEHLAAQLGISVSGFSRIERDEVKVSGERLIRIAELLEVSVDELLRFGDGLIFNNFGRDQIYNRKFVEGGGIEQLDRLYREQITSLKDEVVHLRGLLERYVAREGV